MLAGCVPSSESKSQPESSCGEAQPSAACRSWASGRPPARPPSLRADDALRRRAARRPALEATPL
eukprot:8141405-Lingulodinium_polyedra.AAC.1